MSRAGWSWAAAWRAASTTSTPGTSDSSRQPGQGRPPQSLNGSRILDGAAAAVLTGARSFAAIAEWAADPPQPIRAALGARHDPLAGGFLVPTETTIRRTLGRLDAHALAEGAVPARADLISKPEPRLLR